MIRLDDIEMAFEFVSSGPRYEFEASETRRRLREWCDAESLELAD
jgi:hypothetical protein